MQNLAHEEFLSDIYEFVKTKFRKTGVIVPAIYFIKDEQCSEITPVFFTHRSITVEEMQDIILNYLRTQYPTAFIFCALLTEHENIQEGSVNFSVILQYNRISCPLTTVIKGNIDMNSVTISKTEVKKDIHIKDAPLTFNRE
jgi:hypothetical protein